MFLEKSLRRKKNIDDIEAAAGIWKDRDFDVDEYIRNLRKGNRLKELYKK